MDRQSDSTPAGVSAREYEMLAAFRYALRQFLRFSEKAAREVGVTPQQHQVLLAIKGFPGGERITIGVLAEQLQLQHHSTVGLVDRLVTQALVAREQAVDDRRQVFVTLTAEGERVVEKLSAAHREELRRIKPQIRLLLDQLSGGDDDVLAVLEEGSEQEVEE
jgi:DNA-binding MarR family transcriptional regulator